MWAVNPEGTSYQFNITALTRNNIHITKKTKKMNDGWTYLNFLKNRLSVKTLKAIEEELSNYITRANELKNKPNDYMMAAVTVDTIDSHLEESPNKDDDDPTRKVYRVTFYVTKDKPGIWPKQFGFLDFLNTSRWQEGSNAVNTIKEALIKNATAPDTGLDLHYNPKTDVIVITGYSIIPDGMVTLDY